MPRAGPKKIIRIARILIAFIVAISLSITIVRAVGQLNEHQFALGKVKWGLIFTAILFYVLALATGAIYWIRVLNAFGYRVGWMFGFRTFFLSQLGKYVPGKAMVVVIRTGEIARKGVPAKIGALSVFVETLTWIAVGAVIGATTLSFLTHDWAQVATLAVLVAIFAATPTIPLVLRLVIPWLRLPDKIGSLRIKDMAFGWIVLSTGWMSVGLSLCFVISAIPDVDISPGDLGLCVCCASLATVLGFVSLLPGGIGVRELVMIPMLSSRFGFVEATIAVILMRLVWIASELGLVAIMYYSSSRGRFESRSDHESSQPEVVRKAA